MKKRIAFLCLVGALIVIGYSTSSCGGKEKETSMPASYQSLLPDTVDFLLKIGSVETVYDHFSVTKDGVFGRPLKDLEKIRREWGFNPLVPEELRARGFDTGRELVLALDDIRYKEGTDDPVFNGLILVPVTDARKASESLRNYLKNSRPATLFHEKEPVTYFDAPDPPLRGAMTERDGYILVAVKSEGEIEPYMESLLAAEKSVGETGTFRNVLAGVDPGEEIFVYADIRGIMEANLEKFRRMSRDASGGKGPDLWRNLEYLKDYLGAGLSMDLDRSDLLVKGLLNISPDSDALKVMSGVRYQKQTVLGVPENPVLLFSSAVNVPEYYRMILKTMSPEERKEWDDRLVGIRNNLGVDLENDVIPNMDGNLNIGMYDGVTINMSNYNALVTLSVKDEAKMKTALEQVISRLNPEQRSMIGTVEIGETEAYYITLFGAFQFYLGVKDHNLILSLGKPMFEKAVFGKVGTGFLTRISDPELTRSLKGEGGVFYLNFQEMYQATKNFLFLVRQFNIQESINADSENAFRKFEYLLLSSRVEGASMRGDLKIETRFEKPFWKGLLEMSQEIKAASNAHKEAARKEAAQPKDATQ